MSYLDVIYNEKDRPKTDYPFQLADYLFKRFNMKQGNKLLDVGCGRGDFLEGFKQLGLEALGLDREKSGVEINKFVSAASAAKIKIADIEKERFPFQNERFDFVFSKSVIEHLWSPEHFIKECHRILKPGGRIIIMTPDWQTQMCIFYDDYTHRQPYTETGLRDLLKIYGFKEVSSEIFYQLPVLWKYPWLKIFSRFLQLFGPVKKIYKNKFIRWSRELMVLGTGIK